MQQLRVALLFNRWDVDAFLDEIDADTFEEWSAFVQLEPQGWQADRIGIQRLSYLMAQTNSRKRLKERDFALDIGGKLRSEEAEKARWEAMSIRTELEEEREGERDGEENNQ